MLERRPLLTTIAQRIRLPPLKGLFFFLLFLLPALLGRRFRDRTGFVLGLSLGFRLPLCGLGLCFSFNSSFTFLGAFRGCFGFFGRGGGSVLIIVIAGFRV